MRKWKWKKEHKERTNKVCMKLLFLAESQVQGFALIDRFQIRKAPLGAVSNFLLTLYYMDKTSRLIYK